MSRLIGTVRERPHWRVKGPRYGVQRPNGEWYGLADNIFTFNPAFGGLFAHDVGKRVYQSNGIYQMENDQQLKARTQ